MLEIIAKQFVFKEHFIDLIPTKLSNLLDWALSSGIQIIFIIIAALVIKVIAKKFIQRIVKAATASDRFLTVDAEIKRMQTLVQIFSYTFNTILVMVASIMILDEFKVNTTSLLATVGIAGVAFGFGAQYLVKDLITGIFIIFENQYRLGDVISVGEISGLVEDISLRVTTLRDMDGTVHYIPHGEIKIVSNLTKIYAKINLNVGVAYNSDLDHVAEVVNSIGKQLAIDPAWKDSIIEAPEFLRVNSLDDSSISIKIVGKTKAMEQWAVTGEMRKRIKKTFEKEGIEIPFPQRVLHFQPTKKDEV